MRRVPDYSFVDPRLLKAGADVTTERGGATAKGTTLDRPVGSGNEEIVQLLIEPDATE